MQFPSLLSRRVAGIVLSLMSCVCSTRLRGEDPLPDVQRLQSSPILRHLKPNPMPAPPRTAAEKTIAQMYLPEGFRAELVVAEPELHQPIAFAFDERGRIWVAEAYSYPQKRAAGEGLDQIVIFADDDGDGRFESRKVFAKGLNLVSGLEVGHGGVWIGAAPELLFIADANHDDVPDGPPQALLDGFGYQDTHECLNSFMWGPDGWLYGNQGVFNYARIGKPGAADDQRVELRAGIWRYHPTRHEFEVFAAGGSNQWGLDYDERGQIFMTHCRSYWGRGPTTHVIQGGHYWNQANANYASFIIANPPEGFPEFRNYLLASARYGHGAGGAGKPGTDAVYGGHSHVGTMIYLGDNWPEEFRGHLFTHNLHGHQINQQINIRLGSGFDTVHAGRDQFFCSDPKYVAVDLQYGPDGAVYVIDWYDQQHCHNPNTERWDRGNGRIYRIEYEATYRPKKVDLAVLSDGKLVELLGHRNHWFARTARRLLEERAQAKDGIAAETRERLAGMAREEANTETRLQALWTLHVIGGFSDAVAGRALGDPDEYVRGWTIQLCADDRKIAPALLDRFVQLANTDPSPVVRRYLASAVQRVPEESAWALINALSRHAEDRADRNLPLLLWDGLAARMPAHLSEAFAVAEHTAMPQLAHFVYWYAARLEGDGLDRVIALLTDQDGELLGRRLAGVELAMRSRVNVRMPESWREVAPRLYASKDTGIQWQAERLAAAFGDETAFPRLREALADAKANPALREHAFAVLSRAADRKSVPAFIKLLDAPSFRTRAVQLLGRFDAPEIPSALLSRFEKFSPSDRSAALNALTGRVPFALALLDAVGSGHLKRDQLTAFHVRQLAALKNETVNQRVGEYWGRIHQSPAEKLTLMNRLEKTFAEAPLWAYSANEGHKHFQKLCSSCHRLRDEGTRLGPELTGAGRNGVRYFLENIVDPNAVVGSDFQMTTLELRGGDVLSGLVTAETSDAITLRTTVGESTVAKADVAERLPSELSLMPEGLIEALSDREQLELLKYLTSN